MLRVRISFQLHAFFLIFFSLITMAVRAHAIDSNEIEYHHGLKEIIDRLSKSQPAIKEIPCGTPASPAQRPMGSFVDSPIDIKAAISRWDCRDVFSQKPPNWITSGSQDLWWPVCTAISVERKHQDGMSYEEALFSARTEVRSGYESCAKKTSPSPENAAKAPSLSASSSFTVMSESDRKLLESQIRSEVIPQVIQSCCGSSSGVCAEQMKLVGITWCKPPSNPKEIDPCLESGAAFTPSPDEIRNMRDWINSDRMSRGRKRFPISHGGIYISPYADRQSKHPQVGIGLIAHELGHACSYIQAQVDLKNGTADAASQIEGYIYYDKHCKISSANENFYRSRYSEQGLNNSAFQCVLANSKNAAKSRFTQESCGGACPSEYLEESFANLIALTAINQDQWYPNILPLFCGFKKDANHGLFMDDMGCFVLSPNFVDQVKSKVGCK